MKLKLRMPLQRHADTTVAGRLSFLGDSLFPAGLPRVDQVRGDIDFTGDSLNAKKLTAQFLGGPLRVDAVTQNGHVRFLAQGRATAAGMAPWLGATVRACRGKRHGVASSIWNREGNMS